MTDDGDRRLRDAKIPELQHELVEVTFRLPLIPRNLEQAISAVPNNEYALHSSHAGCNVIKEDIKTSTDSKTTAY